MGILVSSDELDGDEYLAPPALEIPFQRRTEKVVVIGSGPAGFFAAYVLQLAGFQVTIIERGSEVEQRSRDIDNT